MISVNDLAGEGVRVPSRPGAAEPDPLREPDALQEARLLDCRVSRVTSTAALLFGLRTALRFDEGNAALLVVRGLRTFGWDAGTASQPDGGGAGAEPRRELTVVSGAPGRLDDLVRAEFSFLPAARLEIIAEQVDFYVLDAEAPGDEPPRPGAGERADGHGPLPSWDSPCTVLQASGARPADATRGRSFRDGRWPAATGVHTVPGWVRGPKTAAVPRG
ncbi:hypothetical protein [Streptomyces sp. SM10]|uniref:hypothetical protein n=1 Tax=Streptomyces sp. SM10 TaxID=565556 RepID=UPI000CDA0DEB|nr:hypothetical protein [Streptomyces sp. SM10]